MSHKPWPIEKRFWSKVNKHPDCWLWTGNRLKAGYGKFMISSKNGMTTAHRVSWMLHRGPIPDGMFVLHSCDNPPCVNPDHLFLGTHTDNMKDCMSKGRFRGGTNPSHGESHYATKLTEESIKQIRRLRSDGLSYPQIASRFGITDTSARNIVIRHTWKHIQ